MRNRRKATDEDVAGNRWLSELKKILKGRFRALLDGPNKAKSDAGNAIFHISLEPHEHLCEIGDYGESAFLLARGELDVKLPNSVLRNQDRPPAKTSWLGGLLGWQNSRTPQSDSEETVVATLNEDYVIAGEIACLSFGRRTATLVAKTAVEVIEISRAVLIELIRNCREFSDELDRIYLQRGFAYDLSRSQAFQGLSLQQCREIAESLVKKVELLDVPAKTILFRRGDPADAFYLIRSGYIQASHSEALGSEENPTEGLVNYLGPGKTFGEIGLLPKWERLPPESSFRSAPALRTATCATLFDTRLVKIASQEFHELLDRYEPFRNQIFSQAAIALQRSEAVRQRTAESFFKRQLVKRNLYHAQSLLVLDLLSCTRCDECTRACDQSHGDILRFIRDGERFDRYLVTQSCRACNQPTCLIGCPVDAIGRGERGEIRILPDKCIGCEACKENCPFDNIWMVQSNSKESAKSPKVKPKAYTCDLCAENSGPGEPTQCVRACPHDAAFRMSSEEFLAQVERNHSGITKP